MMVTSRFSRRFDFITTHLILGLLGLIALFPVAYTLMTSFKQLDEVRTNPPTFFPSCRKNACAATAVTRPTGHGGGVPRRPDTVVTAVAPSCHRLRASRADTSAAAAASTMSTALPAAR